MKTDIRNQVFKVVIDRKMGSRHPRYSDMVYPLNYGYVREYMAADGEYQDVYLMGVAYPVDTYEAKVIAVIHRNDDIEDKWVAAPEGMVFTEKEITEAVHFQEQYFVLTSNR